MDQLEVLGSPVRSTRLDTGCGSSWSARMLRAKGPLPGRLSMEGPEPQADASNGVDPTFPCRCQGAERAPLIQHTTMEHPAILAGMNWSAPQCHP